MLPGWQVISSTVFMLVTQADYPSAGGQTVKTGYGSKIKFRMNIL